jgi:hypothetical protein
VAAITDEEPLMAAPVWSRPEPKLFKLLQQRFRERRFAKVRDLIAGLLQHQESITILDAGGRGTYWQLLPSEFRGRVRITILNCEQELRAFNLSEEGLRIDNVTGDACSMPQYHDHQFDLVHSNSVIEHVGGYISMRKFADELIRVGKITYIQTPNYWFPIDPHYGLPFLHWLPDTARVWFFSRFNIGFAFKVDYAAALERVEYCRMISPRMFRHFFPDAQHSAERFLLLRKSLIAIQRR